MVFRSGRAYRETIRNLKLFTKKLIRYLKTLDTSKDADELSNSLTPKKPQMARRNNLLNLKNVSQGMY